MRRAAALVITALVAGGAAAGCGSSSSSPAASSSSPAAAGADTYTSVTVSGAFGKSPTLTIPKVKGTGKALTKTVIKGTGATLTSAQGLTGNYVVYDWSGTSSKLLDSSYKDGSADMFVGSSILPAIKTATVGQPLGSRVLAVVPAADTGAASNAQSGIKATDTLVFVIDMDSAFSTTSLAGKQASNGGGTLPTVTAPAAGSKAGPTVTVPTKEAPPKTLQVKTLIKGTGPVIKAGQQAAYQYTGLIWKTGKVFQSSYTSAGASASSIGVGQLIPGFDKGLVGQTAGSRVLLVIPPAQGYGSAGSPQAGIAPTDTLVFVVDILAAT